jgi:Uma2 family endonuclease
MAMRFPRYSKEEFARRGDEIYETQVRPQVEAGNHGKIVAIDIETGAFEIADEILTATGSLFQRIPTAQPWIVRQGQIGVRCPRGIGLDTARIPDVVVMLRDEWQSLQDREAVIGFDLSPPLLVVEVVSPSTKITDYRAKRTEYAVRDIPEYWIVDPIEAKMSVFVLSDGWYDVTEFTNGDRIVSPMFPELQLTPQEIFGV